jgi:hypothetical protein
MEKWGRGGIRSAGESWGFGEICFGFGEKIVYDRLVDRASLVGVDFVR